eukprot:gene2964-3702_t
MNTSKKALTVQLEQISYDPSRNTVIYRINNNCDQELTDAQLQYTFLNVYGEQSSAMLNDRTAHTLPIPVIAAKGQSKDFSFDVDFKEHESIFFLFELTWKGGREKISRTDGFVKQEALERHLTSSAKSVEALHLAIIKGSQEVVAQLLAKGANVNTPQSDWTPLYTAAYSGQKAIAALLLSKGADVKVKNSKGATALHVAALNGHTEIVDQLLSRGADINEKDGNAFTPLHDAAKDGYQETVAKLLTHKDISVNEQDHQGRSALHHAAEKGYLEIVTQLLSKGSDVTIQDNDGCTPLHYAAKKEYIEIVDQLLLKGADVNKKDKKGCSPLHYAAEKGQEEVIIIFLERTGTKVDEKDNDGWSPFDYAKDRGHKKVEEMLSKKIHDSSVSVR